MASINRMSKKPISERISIFESPTGSTNATTTPSSSAKSSSASGTNKINLTKTLSKTNFKDLKSQFDSGFGQRYLSLLNPFQILCFSYLDRSMSRFPTFLSSPIKESEYLRLTPTKYCISFFFKFQYRTFTIIFL